jgi:hypothetical protein
MRDRPALLVRVAGGVPVVLIVSEGDEKIGAFDETIDASRTLNCVGYFWGSGRPRTNGTGSVKACRTATIPRRDGAASHLGDE